MQVNKLFLFDSISNPSHPWSTFWEESLYLEGLSDKLGFKRYIYNSELNGIEKAPNRPITARTWAINALKISACLLGLPFLIMVIGKALHRSFGSYSIVNRNSIENRKNDDKIASSDQPVGKFQPLFSGYDSKSSGPVRVKDGSLIGMIKSAQANDLKPEEMKHYIRGLYLTNNSQNHFGSFFKEAPLFLISWLARLMPNRDDYVWNDNLTLATYQACLRIVIESDYPDKLVRLLAFIRGEEIGIDRHPLDDIRKCCYFKMECERLSNEDQLQLKSLMSPEELKIFTLPTIIDVVETRKHIWEERATKTFDQLNQEEIDGMRPEWVLDLALDFGGWENRADDIIAISLKVKDGTLMLASQILSSIKNYNNYSLADKRVYFETSKEMELLWLTLRKKTSDSVDLIAFEEYCIKNNHFPFGRGSHILKVGFFRASQVQG